MGENVNAVHNRSSLGAYLQSRSLTTARLWGRATEPLRLLNKRKKALSEQLWPAGQTLQEVLRSGRGSDSRQWGSGLPLSQDPSLPPTWPRRAWLLISQE